MGDHAVAGRPDVRAGRWPSCSSTTTAPRTPSWAPASDEQIGVGADPDDDQHEVDVPAERLAVWSVAVDVQPAAVVGAAADPGDRGAGVHLDAVAVELGVHQGAEFGIDGGQHLGQHLDLGHARCRGWSAPSAISRPT